VEYAVNYQYISEELCVNRKNVDLHCNGKCYLAKELSKTNDTDSLPISKGKNSVQKVLDFYIPAEIFKTSIGNSFSFPNLNFTYQTGYTFHFLKNIFRPPIF